MFDVDVIGREILGDATGGANGLRHRAEEGGVAGLGFLVLGGKAADFGLPDNLRETELGAVVGIIAGGLDIVGEFRGGAGGEGTATLVGNNIFAEVLEILGTVEQIINQSRAPFGGHDDRPGNFFFVVINGATEELFDAVLDKAVIAVEIVETLSKGFGEAETANELTHRDLAIAELGFECDLAIGREGMEKDLAIGGINQGIHIRGRQDVVCGEDSGLFITAHLKARDALIIARRRILKKGNRHASLRNLKQS